MVLVFIAFWSLFLASVFPEEARAKLRQKRGRDLAIDLIGLLVQGSLVPAVQLLLLPAILRRVAPSSAGSWDLSPALAVALNFVVVDALYYYNHRLLHTATLWPVHLVHHTLTEMDVLGTSRNTVWTPVLIVYLWVNGTLLFLLRDPTWFALSMSVTAALDLWRHSSVAPRRGSRLHRLLASVLITPHEHGWHHSADDVRCNFGANLSLWDRLHGTYRSPEDAPRALGVTVEAGFTRRAFMPFGLD
jgi:sterol desaturase/sphingolipid hydroxylase (fatty acid hydroxylase superfamily)